MLVVTITENLQIKQHFVSFLTSKYFRADYENLASQIYENLRNGLLHDHVDKNNNFILFRSAKDAPHLQKIQTIRGDWIVFNRETFAKDFLDAWEKFSDDVLRDDFLMNNVLNRINDKTRGFLVIEDIETKNQYKYTGGTIGWWEI